VLPDAELQALMSETLQRRDPSLRVVVSLMERSAGPDLGNGGKTA
jgi:hypothetical protein